MYMLRAISCSSSGGQIVLIQHLVSSLLVSDRPVHRLRKNANGQLDTQILLVHLLQSSTCTCFEQYLAHPQEVKLY